MALIRMIDMALLSDVIVQARLQHHLIYNEFDDLIQTSDAFTTDLISMQYRYGLGLRMEISGNSEKVLYQRCVGLLSFNYHSPIHKC